MLPPAGSLPGWHSPGLGPTPAPSSCRGFQQMQPGRHGQAASVCSPVWGLLTCTLSLWALGGHLHTHTRAQMHVPGLRALQGPELCPCSRRGRHHTPGLAAPCSGWQGPPAPHESGACLHPGRAADSCPEAQTHQPGPAGPQEQCVHQGRAWQADAELTGEPQETHQEHSRDMPDTCRGSMDMPGT